MNEGDEGGCWCRSQVHSELDTNLLVFHRVRWFLGVRVNVMTTDDDWYERELKEDESVGD